MGHSFYLGEEALTKGIQHAISPASDLRKSYVPRDSQLSNSRQHSEDIKRFLESEPPTPSQTYKRRSLDSLFRSGYFSKKSRLLHKSRQTSSKQNQMRNVVPQVTSHGNSYYKIERGPEDLGSSDNLSAFQINFPDKVMKSASSKVESSTEEIRIGEPYVEEYKVDPPHSDKNAAHGSFEKSALSSVVPAFPHTPTDNAVDIFGIAKDYPYLLPRTAAQYSAQDLVTDTNLDVVGPSISVPRQCVESNVRDFATQNSTPLHNPSTFDVVRQKKNDFKSCSEGLVMNTGTAKPAPEPMKMAHPWLLNEISRKAVSRKPMHIQSKPQSPSDTTPQHPTLETTSFAMQSSLPHGCQAKFGSDSNPLPGNATKDPPSETLIGINMKLEDIRNIYPSTPNSPGPAPTSPLPLPPMNPNHQSSLMGNNSLPRLNHWNSATMNSQWRQESSPRNSPIKSNGFLANGIVNLRHVPLPESNTLPNDKSPFLQRSRSPKPASPSEWTDKRVQSRKTLKKSDIERFRVEKEHVAKAKTRNQADYDTEDEHIDTERSFPPQVNPPYPKEALSKSGLPASNEASTSHPNLDGENKAFNKLTPIVIIAEQEPTNHVQDVPLPRMQVPHHPNDGAENPTGNGPDIPTHGESLLPVMTFPTDDTLFPTIFQEFEARIDARINALLDARLDARFTDFEIQHGAQVTEMQAALFRLQYGVGGGVSRQVSGRRIPTAANCNGNGNGKTYSGESWERERFEMQDRLDSMIQAMKGGQES